MEKYQIKGLINNRWEARVVCTNDRTRAKEIGRNMLERQFGTVKIPVIQLRKL